MTHQEALKKYADIMSREPEKPRVIVQSLGGRVYYCAQCRCRFNERPREYLIHPTHQGVLRRKRIACPLAGKKFEWPLVTVDLCEIGEQPQSKPHDTAQQKRIN